MKFKNIKNRLQSKSVKNGSYSLGLTAAVIAIVVVFNLVAGAVHSKYTKIDMSDVKLYSIGSQTEDLLKQLKEDVTLYLIAESGREDKTLVGLLEKYKDTSDHIKVQVKDPVVYPNFTSKYTEDVVADNSIIVESGKRSKVVNYSEMYLSDINYNTQSYEMTGFDGEGQITSAISFVSTDDLPVMYTLEGHNEAQISGNLKSSVAKANIETKNLNLLTSESIPDDAACLFIFAPMNDLSQEESSKIIKYLESGGRALIVSSYVNTPMPNFKAVMENYGVKTADGIVIEGDTSMYYPKQPQLLIPKIQDHEITSDLKSENRQVFMPLAQGIQKLDNYRSSIDIKSLLSTSDNAYSKINPEEMETYTKEEGDIEGPFDLGVAITETYGDKETRIAYFTSENMLADQFDGAVSGANTQLLTEALSWMCEQKESVSIASKSLSLQPLTLTAANVRFWSIVTTGLLPLAVLLTGGLIWLRRRKS